MVEPWHGMVVEATRYHDISTGHRVHGHESKCQHLHGHNYRVTFYCRGPLDNIGRVLDFGVIKSALCMWLENEWDHRFLVSSGDPWAPTLKSMDADGVVIVPFNPTAENMAIHLLTVVGPAQLAGTPVTLVRVLVEETRKCAAIATGANA